MRVIKRERWRNREMGRRLRWRNREGMVGRKSIIISYPFLSYHIILFNLILYHNILNGLLSRQIM